MGLGPLANPGRESTSSVGAALPSRAPVRSPFSGAQPYGVASSDLVLSAGTVMTPVRATGPSASEWVAAQGVAGRLQPVETFLLGMYQAAESGFLAGSTPCSAPSWASAADTPLDDSVGTLEFTTTFAGPPGSSGCAKIDVYGTQRRRGCEEGSAAGL